MKSILWGIASIILGAYILFDTIKNPVREGSALNPKLSGYLSGGLFIVMGIYLIYNQLI
jgi:hypothetical protein